jgi:hypothetical protein
VASAVIPADSFTSPPSGWLLACLHALGRRRPVPAPPSDLDWDALLTLAETEDLLPAVAYAANGGRWAFVPDAARRSLAAGLAASRARHLVMTRELARALRHCAADAIDVIVLKGPVLAETVYPDPALRPFSDLDLLVRPGDRRRADAALRALGYEPLADEHSWDFDIAFDGATVYESAAGVRIDLHWMLLTEARYAWNQAGAAAVWERAVPITLAGERALGLAPEDLVLHLATHFAVHHSLTGVLRRWDLALVLAQVPLDWPLLRARADDWRVRQALFFALSAVSAAFPSAVPRPALIGLRPRGPRAALLTRVLDRASADRRQRLEHLITLLLIDRARDLAVSARDALWPSTDWLRARYGRESVGFRGLYLAHLRRLAGVMAGAGGRA